MKQFMKYSLFLLLCSAIFTPRVNAVTTVVPNTGGSAATDTTFQSAAIASAFYRPTNTMFFGLTGNTTTGHPSTDALGYCDDTYTDQGLTLTYTGIAWTGAADIALNGGPSGSNAAYFTATDNAAVQNSNITSIALVGNPATDATRVTRDDIRILFLSSQGNNGNLPVGVHCMTTTLGIPVYKSLTDGDGTVATVNTMTLAAGVQDTTMFGFAAVKDGAVAGSGTAGGLTDGSGASERGTFGATDGDGIACVTLDTNNLMTQISGRPVDTLLGTTLAVRVAGLAKDVAGDPVLCYDEVLGRLYVGLGGVTSAPAGVATSGGAAAVGIWGVGMFEVDASQGTAANKFPAMKVMSGEAGVSGALVLTGSNIVGAKGARSTVAINKMKVMHTSTGPSVSGATDGATKFAYLIVNGGNGYIADTAVAGAAGVANRVWAVPLVVGHGTPANDGKLAAVTTRRYDTVASAAGDLFLTDTAAVRVGNGPLPCTATTRPSDMWVDGDSVYISIDTAESASITPGIFQSQACFNSHGQIDHWTEWARVSTNELGGVAATNKGRISHFAVDAASTQIWGVDTDKTSLRLSKWQNSSTTGAATPAAKATGLLSVLNGSSNMGEGCSAVCDLNSSSTGWGATTPMRMTMFGGVNGKVSFAITGSGATVPTGANSLMTTNTGLNRYVDFDYSTAADFKTTSEVSAGNSVNCLAFSGWNGTSTTGDKLVGYFFAGVEKDQGLYAWTLPNMGAGFNPAKAYSLNSDPYRDATGAAANYRSWQQLDRFSGTPIKIVAKGGAIYILSQASDASQVDRIFRITRKGTAALLNTDFCVTASAGQAPSGSNSNLSSVGRIYDFVVTVTTLSTAASGSQGTAGSTEGEQLMMLTDDGIYTTTCSIGTDDWTVGKKPANSQLLCGWERMSSPISLDTWQYIINSPEYTRDPSTFWFGRSEVHKVRNTIFNRVTFRQMSRKPLLLERGDEINDGTTWGNWNLNPTLFNGYDGTAVEPTAFDQLPLAKVFYSDGSRRIFQHHSSWLETNDFNLFSIPYETGAKYWNIESDSSNEIADSVIGDNNYTYWISPIGGTGKLFAGTGTGVIGLV